MNIAEIKNSLGVQTLPLSQDYDKDNNPTDWVHYWDNTNRRSIGMHKDVLTKIKADPTMDTLAVKDPVIRTTQKGDYTLFTIYAYTEDESEVVAKL